MSRLSWIRAQREAIALMVRRAKDAGIALTGPDGLLKAVTAQIVEAVLDEELNEHLGYGKHDPVGRGGGNSRNGTRSKAVMTDNVGVVEIQVGQGLPGHDQALAQRLDRVVPFLDYDARDPHGRVLDERDRVGFPDTESEVRGLSRW